MAAAVEAGDRFRAEAPEMLFEDRFWRDNAGAGGTLVYDVMPDGQHFVMIRLGNAVGAEPGVVVLNFARELERLVPN